MASKPYVGRLAPTPTGHLHLGHAATFREAHSRARAANGRLILRIEDLDPQRCRPEFTAAVIADLRWLALDWDDEPILQSTRRAHYLITWQRLRDCDAIYPCNRSRRDVANAAHAPHDIEGDAEPLYPADWRPAPGAARAHTSPDGTNWRFRVPNGETITFHDQRLGTISRTAGNDFGDFLVWNRDNIPAYELAVVVDDAAMNITEVVRGEDLLSSTCRQILLYRALGLTPPAFFHCPLVRDPVTGRRLAKRDHARSIQSLREAGLTPGEIFSNGAGTFQSPPPNSQI